MEKVEDNHFMLQVIANTDGNQFNFLLSPWPKPMIDCELEIQPQHEPQS